MPRSLNIDPGFGWMGWSIAELTREGSFSVEAMGLIRTERSDKKRRVREADDVFRRLRELSRELVRIVDEYDPQVVMIESYSPPRNASSAGKIGGAYGAIALLTETRRLPVVSSTPQEIKKIVCGRRDASKEDVKEACRKLMKRKASKQALQLFTRKYKAVSNHHHAWDSIGALVAGMHTDTVLMISKGVLR